MSIQITVDANLRQSAQWLTNRETYNTMVITVYKIDGSPPARAVLMTVEILGLKIETKEVNTIAKDQFKPEYLEMNPTHTIPLLQDGDFILPDSHAIITYLVSKYGADLRSTLYPVDLRTRATIDHRMYVDATLVFPKIRTLVISILKDKAPGPSEEQTEEVHEAYGFIEKYLERSPFLAAEHITVADISAVSTISSLNAIVPIDVDKFPRIVEWWEKLKVKEWYQKANVPGLTQFEQFLKVAMEQNAKSA